MEESSKFFVMGKPRGSVVMTYGYKGRWKDTWLRRSELGNGRRLVRKSKEKQLVSYRVRPVGSFSIPNTLEHLLGYGMLVLASSLA